MRIDAPIPHGRSKTAGSAMFDRDGGSWMSKRLERFRAMKDHGWFHKSWKKCKEYEIGMGERWILEHDHLDHNEFQLAINKMYLDRPEMKALYKNLERIQEMISNSNLKGDV